MANSAAQNPADKVGRNSGAGPQGVSEIAPTAQEAARGVRPVTRGAPPADSNRLVAGLSAVAVLGAGVATYFVRRARQPRGPIARIRRAVGLK